jgi:hypothetical protein
MKILINSRLEMLYQLTRLIIKAKILKIKIAISVQEPYNWLSKKGFNHAK